MYGAPSGPSTGRGARYGEVVGDGAQTDEIDWLSSGEAARRLGIATRTLYRLIDDGQVPAYRFGRVIRLQRVDVDDYIERCRIEPGSLDMRDPSGTSGVSES